MDKEKKKSSIIDFFNRPTVRFINWTIICILATIFGLVVGEYGLSIIFPLILVIKYFQMKYPDLL